MDEQQNTNLDEMNGVEIIEDVPNEEIDKKLRQYFDGKIVRKDLTKSIKEGAMFLSRFLNSFSDSIAVLMILL